MFIGKSIDNVSQLKVDAVVTCSCSTLSARSQHPARKVGAGYAAVTTANAEALTPGMQRQPLWLGQVQGHCLTQTQLSHHDFSDYAST